jgi:hypothetical protein
MKELRGKFPKAASGFVILALLGCSVAVTAAAQQPAGQGQQAPPTVANSVRNLYNGVKNNIVRSGDKMPEEFYGLRPGTQEEVRTFGQHLAHVANFNYLWCAQAKGEKNPNAGINLEKTLLNIAHNNELYGSIATTLRIKNIVPPASEPRPQQAPQQRPQ